MPVGPELARERDDRGGGAPERLEVDDLRADVRVQADDLEPGAIASCAGTMSRRLGDRHAELVGLEAGRDVRDGCGRRCRG